MMDSKSGHKVYHEYVAFAFMNIFIDSIHWVYPAGVRIESESAFADLIVISSNKKERPGKIRSRFMSYHKKAKLT